MHSYSAMISQAISIMIMNHFTPSQKIIYLLFLLLIFFFLEASTLYGDVNRAYSLQGNRVMVTYFSVTPPMRLILMKIVLETELISIT